MSAEFFLYFGKLPSSFAISADVDSLVTDDVYTDVVVKNWSGVAIGSYIIAVELLSSFLIPNEHIHFKGVKTEVHEKCDN